MDIISFNLPTKTKLAPKYILALLAVFLIGAAAGALVFYRLNDAIFAPKTTWADFEKKFQEKIKNGNLALLTFPQDEYANEPIDNFSGIIAKIESADSFEVKVKNFYKTGDLIDFVLNQPDFYIIKVLADKNTKISDFVFVPSSVDSGLRVEGMLIKQERVLAMSNLKEGQAVNVFLEKAVSLPETTNVRATAVRVAFGSIPAKDDKF